MITGELKNKIDGLWDIFAAGGLVNPLEVIEQITYLMFIHDLDDAIFKLPTPMVLSKLMDSLNEIYKMMNEIKEEKFKVEMMDPSSEEIVCDPTCDTYFHETRNLLCVT